jgi:hypothetical protein
MMTPIRSGVMTRQWKGLAVLPFSTALVLPATTELLLGQAHLLFFFTALFQFHSHASATPPWLQTVQRRPRGRREGFSAVETGGREARAEGS